MNALYRFGWFTFALNFVAVAVACEAPCTTCTQPTCVAEESRPSWIFNHSTYTHDPNTGARVAQYMRTPPVEPLEDERCVTSRYRRLHTNLRGADGSTDTTYEVQAWGNGRGGIDSEWERFHDAWKESYLQGGYYNGPAYGGYPGRGYGNGYNGGGYGGPGYGNGFPGNGFPGGGNGGPGNWGPQQGPPWQNNGGPGPQGNNGPGGNGPSGNGP